MQFHVLSFEGPDEYARAGGIASRVTGLVRALADAAYETHLWFVGDPARPGHESQGSLHLHRWCQWISQYHPSGVYEAEEGSAPTMWHRCRHFFSGDVATLRPERGTCRHPGRGVAHRRCGPPPRLGVTRGADAGSGHDPVECE